MKIPRIVKLATATVALVATFSVVDGAQGDEKNSVSQAYELRMEGKVDPAKEMLVAALVKDPKNAAAHFELARVYFYTMDLEAALKEVELAVALCPDNARYHHLGGMAAVYHAIRLHHCQENRDEAFKQMKRSLESFRRAVELDPKNHEARLQLINLYLKNPPDAGASRTEAEKHSKKLEALDAIAGAKARCMMLGRESSEKQRETWARVVAKHPNSAAAHEGLGRILLQLGDTDKAVGHLDRALKLDPARSIILVDLARHYFFAKEYDLAERSASRYLDFKPAPSTPMRAYVTFMIARIQKVQGHHERAEELLARAKKLDPQFWQTVMQPPEILLTAPRSSGQAF